MEEEPLTYLQLEKEEKEEEKEKRRTVGSERETKGEKVIEPRLTCVLSHPR